MKKKHKFIIRVISWILFIIYLVMMVYFLFFSEMLGRTPSDTYHYNLKPFTEIQRYITYYRRLGSFYVLLNIVGNVLCFMPLGFVLPVLSYKNRIQGNIYVYAVLGYGWAYPAYIKAWLVRCRWCDIKYIGRYIGIYMFCNLYVYI